ncbi:unnamed protein product [Rhodiola kirilowii]
MDHRVMSGPVIFSNNNNLSSSSSSSSSKQSQEDHHHEEYDMNTMMEDLRRGPWTDEEDQILSSFIAKHGEGKWNSLARCAGLNRTGKSCRLRWLNYLRPDVRRGNISLEEQLLILELHSRWGNRWSKIAKYLPGRTDNEIKNYWRTRVQKHAKQLKCDVNSQQFKDTMKYLWMPRLVERIHAATIDTNNNTFHDNTQLNAISTTDQTQYGFTNSTNRGGYESYGPFSNQVSPISDLLDGNYNDDTDFAPANSYQSNIGYNGETSFGVNNPMEYDCNNAYGQQVGFMGYGGGDHQMHPSSNHSNSDEWMTMQNGMVSDNLWNVDDFWFNNSQQLEYQQQ